MLVFLLEIMIVTLHSKVHILTQNALKVCFSPTPQNQLKYNQPATMETNQKVYNVSTERLIPVCMTFN